MRTASEHGLSLRILDAVEGVNEAQKGLFVAQVFEDLGADLSACNVAVWGLAFKPDTDDMREAPSLTVIRGLRGAGATIRVHDPEAQVSARALLGESVIFEDDPYACLKDADALILLTEWAHYRTPEWPRGVELMRGTRVYDGRNLWDAREVKGSGLMYAGIGRGRD